MRVHQRPRARGPRRLLSPPPHLVPPLPFVCLFASLLRVEAHTQANASMLMAARTCHVRDMLHRRSPRIASRHCKRSTPTQRGGEGWGGLRRDYLGEVGGGGFTPLY